MLCKQCFRKRLRQFIIELLFLIIIVPQPETSSEDCAGFSATEKHELKKGRSQSFMSASASSYIPCHVIMFQCRSLISLKADLQLCVGLEQQLVVSFYATVYVKQTNPLLSLCLFFCISNHAHTHNAMLPSGPTTVMIVLPECPR